MRYKIGDWVMVRRDLKGNWLYKSLEFLGTSLFCSGGMCNYRGKTFQVTDIEEAINQVYPECYKLEGAEQWSWSSEMLIPVKSIAYYLNKRKEVII